ncbi:riboflavin synthase [Thermocrinis minervae]|uniref:Riboflavin synthase n=1 Tax=Thermocrinis minervae TaxID=381751 RepID=A0A1M6RVI1_9AQUI|nr:riboflavin synthase [Thermocrinis minervae]SHK36485.1 riboflavin synthase alpha chain [Thermocrinis minervae]
MFTGLVQEVGKVQDLRVSSSGGRLVVSSSFEDLKLGESVAVNGVCLTLVEGRDGLMTFDLSPETLSRSNLRLLKKGDLVNLERALRADDRLGGHILQGHVDCMGRITRLDKLGEHWTLEVELPDTLYVVEKGSIGIDGISLTVNYIRGNTVSINVIPHTYHNTNLKVRKVGDYVNVEFDVIGKYVINYLSKTKKSFEKLLEEFLG